MIGPKFAFAILFAAPIARGQSIIHVPADLPTIQQAIEAAADGDTVLVAEGTYVQNLDLLGKRIELRSTGKKQFTKLRPSNPGTVVRFVSGEGRDTVLDGFTIQLGNTWSTVPASGAAIYVEGSSPTIRNCVIRDNIAATAGGLASVDGGPLVQNCVVSDNHAVLGSAAMHFSGSSATWAVVIHCVVYLNQTYSGDPWDAAITSDGAPLLVVNTVCRENPGGTDIDVAPPGIVTHCNYTWHDSTNGNIEVDPLFLEPQFRDFHLRAASPCRDAGTRQLPNLPGVPGSLPATDFEGDPRLVGDAPDMGADEYTTHISHTGVAAPGATIFFWIVGAPPGAPCFAWLSGGLADPPIPTAFGLFRLADRRVAVFTGTPMWDQEMTFVQYTIPAAVPPSFALYAQALADSTLSVVEVVLP